ncbi:MAG: hypothetical protein N4A33_00965 [Bacteriovoracaceae bacterium]|jgi:hypothetical protein|nr:hypothetical protein [Bacteriovoracaceae bacterium]
MVKQLIFIISSICVFSTFAYSQESSNIFHSKRHCLAITMDRPSYACGDFAQEYSQDCRAIITELVSWDCLTSDCYGFYIKEEWPCKSNDCIAYVRSDVSMCETENCKAFIYDDPSFCESTSK